MPRLSWMVGLASIAMAEAGRTDPFSDMITLVAGPIAAVIRSFDQLRKGADELMRGLEKKLKSGVGKEPERGVTARELKRAETTGVGGGVA